MQVAHAQAHGAQLLLPTCTVSAQSGQEATNRTSTSTPCHKGVAWDAVSVHRHPNPCKRLIKQ